MAVSLIRKAAWLTFGALALLLLAVMALSTMAAQRLAGSGISEELSLATGRRVVIRGAPEIEIFPDLAVTVAGVSLHDWKDASDAHPLMEAAAVRLHLEPLAAIAGRVSVRRLDLEAPVLPLRPQRESGAAGFLGADSRPGRVIAAARAALAADPAAAEIGDLRGVLPSVISITNGTLQLAAGAMTGINGEIRLPDATPAGSAVLNGIWNGEAGTLALEADDVLRVIAGGESPTQVEFSGNPLVLKLAGDGRLEPAFFVSGAIKASAPSLARAMTWLGKDMPLGNADTPVEVSGTLTADAGKWQFDELVLQLDGSTGRGALTLVPDATPLSASGTLDFETLDLAALTRHFSEMFKSGRAEDALTDSPSLRSVNFDIRFSAAKAQLAGFALTDLAASAQISSDMAAIDINNAGIYGGSVQAALKIDRTMTPARMEVRLLGEAIETAGIKAVIEGAGRLPTTRGDISAILEGPAEAVDRFLLDATGTLKIRAGEGRMPGIDEARILEQLRAGGFSRLDFNADAALAFSEMICEAELAAGTLRLTKFHAGLEKAALDLGGAYALADDSFALSGRLTLEPDHPQAADGDLDHPFFLGGGRSSPFLSTGNVSGPPKP